jgi:Tol biopolymer transport system component
MKRAGRKWMGAGHSVSKGVAMSVRAMLGTMLIALAAPESIQAQETKVSAPPKVSASRSEGNQEAAARAVDRLVEQLQRHPVQPRPAADRRSPDRYAIYLMDVVKGETRLIVDEPAPGLVRCGSPAWSNDGRRILFDATPGKDFSLSRLQSVKLGEGEPSVADFGAGNCPTFAPADDRIAFLSNADGAENGVWLMKADGSERSPLGDYGIPKWSPDGRQMMIVAFSEPRRVTIMDAKPEKSGVVTFPDFRIHSIPSWAGPGMIVAVTGAEVGDQVSLIDVIAPTQSRVKEVLWRRANGPDVTPTYPIYSAVGRRYVFVGGDAKGMLLYTIPQGKGDPTKPVGKQQGFDSIVNLAFSPDGRYVLYSAHGRD